MESQRARGIFTANKLSILSLAYLLALSAASLLIYYGFPLWGNILYSVILFTIIVRVPFAEQEAERGFWTALGLAPLIGIVNLVAPVSPLISQYFSYIIISIPVIVAIIIISRANKYSLDNLGLNFRRPVIQLLVVLVGAGLAIIDFYILKPAAWTSTFSVWSTLSPALVLLIFTGFLEELVFRGVMQKASGALGDYGWVYIAAVYAVLQIGQKSFLHCLLALAAGLFFGWIVKETKSIAGVSLAHGLINIGLYLVLPYIL